MEKNYTDEIEKYLLGRLDENAATALETRLKTDPELAAELEIQREIQRGIELFGDEKLCAKIAEVDRSLAAKGFFDHENHPKTTEAQGRFFNKSAFRWSAAASVLLILGAGFWYFSKNQNAPAGNGSPNKEVKTGTPIFEKPAPPKTARPENTAPAPAEKPAPPIAKTPKPSKKPAQPIARSSENPTSKYRNISISHWQSPDFSNVRAAQPDPKSVLARAAEAFQKNDFQRVVDLLAPVRPDEKMYWQASEILAHAYFKKGDLKKATARFREISESGKLPFSERGDWFLLLCYAQNFPAEKAVFAVLIRKILADPGHPYFENAKKLKIEMGKE